MGKLFLKRSQTSGGGATSTTVTTSNTSRNSSRSSTSNFASFRNRNRSDNRNHQQQQQVQGSEAVAVESQRINAKTFNYPKGGFETWIEHSLLYTMIRESNIFPAETVLKTIDDEDFTQYFIIKQKQQLTEKFISDDDDDDDGDGNSDNNNHQNNNSKRTIELMSYAQLTAVLALAGEEWASTSDVPQQLCKVISKQIIKFANKENLDREQELRELLNPLIDYAKGRGRKQALQMLPWFAALTVSTVNPLAFYATYMSMLAANSDSLSKGDRADRNTINMAEMGSRHGNVEKASLLDEDYYNESDD